MLPRPLRPIADRRASVATTRWLLVRHVLEPRSSGSQSPCSGIIRGPKYDRFHHTRGVASETGLQPQADFDKLARNFQAAAILNAARVWMHAAEANPGPCCR